VTEYEDSSQRKRRLGHSSHAQNPDADVDAPTLPRGDDSGAISQYYKLDTIEIAETGYFARYGDGTAGPHPEHGPMHSDPDECTNFAVEGSGWFCFAHESGGAALDLAAVLCPHTDVDCRDLPKNAASRSWLSEQRPTEMLRACLWLRDKCGVADDADPPYTVLEAAADHAGLHTGRGDGLGAHKEAARTIFDELNAGEV
jgi:hypothetical protein